jgi:hypothetical protein
MKKTEYKQICDTLKHWSKQHPDVSYVDYTDLIRDFCIALTPDNKNFNPRIFSQRAL